MKTFSMVHLYAKESKPKLFDESNAPDWLTSKNTTKGSTMDDRWFWNDHVLQLGINESIKTDFQIITRLT